MTLLWIGLAVESLETQVTSFIKRLGVAHDMVVALVKRGPEGSYHFTHRRVYSPAGHSLFELGAHGDNIKHGAPYFVDPGIAWERLEDQPAVHIAHLFKATQRSIYRRSIQFSIVFEPLKKLHGRTNKAVRCNQPADASCIDRALLPVLFIFGGHPPSSFDPQLQLVGVLPKAIGNDQRQSSGQGLHPCRGCVTADQVQESHVIVHDFTQKLADTLHKHPLSTRSLKLALAPPRKQKREALACL